MSLSSLAEDAPADDPSPTDRVRRRRRRSRRSRLKHTLRRRLRDRSRATSVGVTVLVLLVAFGAARMVAAHKDLKGAEEAFLEARDAVSETRTDDAADALEDAEERLDAAKRKATGFPLGLVKPIPVLGSPAKAVTDVVKAGRELVAAGRVINEAAAAFPTAGKVAVDGHDLSQFHGAAREADQALLAAKDHVRAAQHAVKGPAGALLPQISGPARSAATTIQQVSDQLAGADRGLQLLARLSNPASSTRLLVIAQDTLELRATGGYIGSFGILEFRDGTARLESYRSFEDLQPGRPISDAPPLLRRGLIDRWSLENSNWWPDFPTSAQAAAGFLELQANEHVDGVLGLTEDVLGSLAGVLGPVQVPGYNEPVSGSGFAERVLYETTLKRPRDVPRKKFLVELSHVVFDRLLQLDRSEVPAVVEVFRAAVSSGSAQVWFDSAQLQGQVAGLAVAGELPDVDEDFLMLVETNMSAGKANLGLTRDATYHVRRDEHGQIWARLDITYRNDRPADPVLNPYYAGLLRVYVPRGARLERSASVRDAGLADDGPYRTFVSDVYVEPRGEAHVSIAYRLPDSVAPRSRYELTWQRQVGTQRDVLRAQVNGRTSLVDGRALHLVTDLRRNRLREFLEDRWIGRFL